MTPDRKHPSVAFWLTVAVVAVLVLYVLGSGPACWLSNQSGFPQWGIIALGYIYQPLDWLTRHSEWCSSLQDWYLGFWSEHHS